MIQKEKIRRIVEEKLSGSDVYLVDVTVSADNRISVEIDAKAGISIDFCAELSRYIEAQLDREIEDFELEVGTPGLGQPFKVLQQYQKFIDREVEVLTAEGKKMSGVLLAADEDGFSLEISYLAKPEGAKRKIEVTETIDLKYHQVKYTKYIIRFK
ncbi:MAG: ribosome assembly cofactor RimP [Prevotellaceae bacterium]|jgi:ribosome maturation factor RimP|nr:ribosome assembly cofactor RimP [Prevotellaceae bacterium]